MRKAAKPTEQEIIEGPQAVSFQIANGNARQRCILQTESSDQGAGPEVSSDQLAAIERMARERSATGILEDGQIKLVVV